MTTLPTTEPIKIWGITKYEDINYYQVIIYINDLKFRSEDFYRKPTLMEKFNITETEFDKLFIG